jgi:uncharacterized MnhB-related membrane protein
MIQWLFAFTFILTGACGTAVVLTRTPLDQVLVLGLYGLLLSICMVLLEAPDVALSELAIGGAALPLMLLASIAKIRRNREERSR